MLYLSHIYSEICSLHLSNPLLGVGGQPIYGALRTRFAFGQENQVDINLKICVFDCEGNGRNPRRHVENTPTPHRKALPTRDFDPGPSSCVTETLPCNKNAKKKRCLFFHRHTNFFPRCRSNKVHNQAEAFLETSHIDGTFSELTTRSYESCHIW